MNKFKKILLGVASVLTLGALFTVTGVRSIAKMVSSTFTFSSNLPELAKYENSTAPSANVTATDSDTNESLTLSVTNYFTGGTIKYNSNNYLNRASTSDSEYALFEFTTKGTGKLTLTKFTTQSTSKYATIILTRTNDDVNTEVYNNRIAVKDTNQEYTLSAAGKYSLKICGDSTQTSNLKFSSMVITDSYDDGLAEEEKFSVSYENNGHGATVNTVNVSKLVASNLPELSEAGYVFGGWFYDDETFENSAQVGDNISAATILYAKWTAVPQYVVTYNVDGQATSSNVNAGTTITLNAAPSKTNAVFNGWSDGSSTYAAGASYTVNSAVTFTATWTTFVAGDALEFDASDLYGTYPNTINNQMIVDGTIFTIYADSSKTVTLDGNKMTLSDGSTELTGRLKLGGTADFATPLRVIGFTAPSDGTINVDFVSGSDTKSRSLAIKDSNGNQIASVSNSSGSNAVLLSANVESGKTYYIGSSDSGINIGKVEFVTAPEVEVTPLVQEATDTDYTYVRFVTIVSNAGEISSDDVEFSITMEYTNETTKTVNYTPYVVKRITQSGATYVADVNSVSHTFDNAINETEYYVVYVIRFTTSKFTGCKVSATTTFAGQDYTSSQVTI